MSEHLAKQRSTLVIFGASGDLTHRLLLPGLGTLLRQRPHHDIHLVGAAADDLSEQDWKQRVADALCEGGCSADRSTAIVAGTEYKRMDATDATALHQLLTELADPERPIVLYFALPPTISQRACEALARIDLPPNLRLAIEKPFGHDLESAQKFNKLLTSLVPEEQVFRVDHYLGKATVLNLIGLRFSNRVFEPTWNATNIERVEIITDEQLALEGRAGYYDGAGALKDMLQSHLMLVMAMVAMEEPAAIDQLELRDLMVHALRATHLWADDPVASSRRARYTAGTIGEREVPSYVDEPGVDPSRNTETLAEVTLEVRNARWTGVPFRLRSGKALGDGFRGIIVKYRPIVHPVSGFHNAPEPNVLAIGIAPETISMQITTNASGDRWDLEQTVLHSELGESPVRPYGEILDLILSGDPLLSVRGDMAEECWRVLGPVLAAWHNNEVPLEEYRAGSTGPTTWR
ncbi:glucose-6-phosphate dehydrogenase [Propionibacteriaceae bacterium G57]|uniref:glucose-6-phosphate dehydrogenase n=1 Tax=Aestuariimicrobium sp. G57 TaxID=3418485 RepID=UPI003DA6D941